MSAIHSVVGALQGSFTSPVFVKNYGSNTLSTIVINTSLFLPPATPLDGSAVAARPGFRTFVVILRAGGTIGSLTLGQPAVKFDNSFTAGDTIYLINDGYIIGRGGNGGKSYADNNTATVNGEPGGLALDSTTCQAKVIIINNKSGIIGGGGGGGGAQPAVVSNATYAGNFDTYYQQAGGGGAGISGGTVYGSENPGFGVTQATVGAALTGGSPSYANSNGTEITQRGGFGGGLGQPGGIAPNVGGFAEVGLSSLVATPGAAGAAYTSNGLGQINNYGKIFGAANGTVLQFT